MLGYRDTADILVSGKFCYSYHEMKESDNFELFSKFKFCLLNGFSRKRSLINL